MKKLPPKPFGYHLMLDLYDCAPEHMENVHHAYTLLDEVVEKIKMQKQSPPYVFISDSKAYPEKAGLSGWVPLIESGLMIHTLTPTRAVFVDLFSCRKFDTKMVENFFKKAYRAKRVESYFLERGKTYYRKKRP